MTLTNIEPTQSERQALELCKVLLTTQTGSEFDGIQAMRFFMSKFNFRADWHLWTDAMVSLTNEGKAVCTQAWGYTKYRIN